VIPLAQLTDTFNLFSKLSFRKIINAFLILKTYYISKYTKKLMQGGLPISIAFEPTTSCNLKCPQCPSGLRQFSRPTGKAQTDIFEKLIDEISPTLLYLTLYFQGEPYLHPQFLDLVKYAHQNKIYTATSTNAHYLTDANAKKTVESGLDRIIISLDGTTQESYQKYRLGGKLDKVLTGIETLVHWKKKLKSKTPHIIAQFIVFKHNEHELKDIKLLAKKLGVDKLAIKTAQIYNYQQDTELIPSEGKYARYQKNEDGEFHIKNNLVNSCWRMWSSCVITWDGKVVPCCFDKDAAKKLGDISQNKFKTIWTNSNYVDFRRKLLKSRKEIDICKNCSEGTKVWL
jgi:radical SAM protein with 4Fe4S-binding SPASM domain